MVTKMFKRTKFFVGVSLLAQSLSFIVACIVLAAKKKSIWKTVLAIGLAGGAAGTFLTVSALRSDRKFRRVLAAVDDLCAPDEDDEFVIEAVPVDDTANEAEFEA